ncbi:MAG: DNA primase [Acetobacteraceae bacterium]|jgi:DNA primase
MALPPQFLDELRARTPLPAVIGRRVRLARSGRQWKGCCPFHGEKTPSFYVYDDHYHCFGCGKHGDAITFVMDSQGASFPEAVEQLAAEAGMQVPKPSPEAAEAEKQRLDLAAVLDAAAASFQRRLFLPEGKAARDYLTNRGLSDETIRRYGLGWSGEGRGAVAADLAREGVTAEQLVDSGLMRRDDETGRVFDLFFNRVMFPIRDRRGRTISFGGRIMGDGQPKYVNGPETALFSKRRTLFGIDLAREAVRRGETLVVVEGYMDVIALGQAGFGAAVAPLGTALTEEQLGELWQLSPAPVLCFDGDAAGARAAARAAELALPMLTPERTLKLIALPAGDDPDSLIRDSGAAKFQSFLAQAQPLAKCLFGMLQQQGGGATPEERAAFRAKLRAAAAKIQNSDLAKEYSDALWEQFRESRERRRADRNRFSGPHVSAPVRLPPRPLAQSGEIAAERARILTAILLRHPGLFHDVEHAYAGLDLDPPLTQLRDAIGDWAIHAEVLDSQALIDHLTKLGLHLEIERILAGTPIPLPACASSAAMPAEAEEGWWHIFGFLNVDRLREEVDLARQDMARGLTGETQRRLERLKDALNKVSAGEPDGLAAA